MRAVWLEPDPAYLEKRRRLGWDKKDEVWDGVLHLVSVGSYAHGHLCSGLAIAFRSIAKRRALVSNVGSLGVFEPNRDDNYRVPDVTLVRPEHIVKRGVEGAELVVEVLSPYDESRDKFPFYAKLGVREVWIVEPDSRETEVYELVGDGYRHVPFGRSPLLGIALEIVDGPLLRLRDGDEIHDV